jgi:hypothetical protein
LLWPYRWMKKKYVSLITAIEFGLLKKKINGRLTEYPLKRRCNANRDMLIYKILILQLWSFLKSSIMNILDCTFFIMNYLKYFYIHL